MKKISFLLSLIFMVSSVNTSAQISFKTEYIGESNYRKENDETTERIGNSKGSARIYEGNIRLPLSMKKDEKNRLTAWGINASGAYVDLDNKNFTENLVLDEMMNTNLSVFHLRPISEKWSLLAVAGVGVYSADTKLSKMGANQVLGNISAIFIRHFNSNLELGGGLAFNNSFGYPMVFPAIYLKWKTNGKYFINISLLDGLGIVAGYEVNNYLSLSIIAEMNGQMALLKKEGKDVIFSHQYIVTGFRPEFKLGKNVKIPITLGINANRQAEYSNRNLKSMFNNQGYYFDLSFYISGGISYGF